MSTNLDTFGSLPYKCDMKTVDQIRRYPKPEDSHIYYAPSKIWSQRLGVPLHFDWRIKDHKALQEMVAADPNKFNGSVLVDYLYSVLTSAFPKLLELQNVVSVRRTLQYDVVLGCLSQFLFDDMKYFLEVDTYDRCPKHVGRLREIERKLDIGYGPEQFNWVVSPITLTRIEAAIVW